MCLLHFHNVCIPSHFFFCCIFLTSALFYFPIQIFVSKPCSLNFSSSFSLPNSSVSFYLRLWKYMVSFSGFQGLTMKKDNIVLDRISSVQLYIPETLWGQFLKTTVLPSNKKFQFFFLIKYNIKKIIIYICLIYLQNFTILPIYLHPQIPCVFN